MTYMTLILGQLMPTACYGALGVIDSLQAGAHHSCHPWRQQICPKCCGYCCLVLLGIVLFLSQGTGFLQVARQCRLLDR